jgi:hypothetical protein
MLTRKFDAYGAILPDVSRNQREVPTTASAVLGRIGQYVFWSLVVIIVSARIAFYPANPATEFRTASESRQTVTR